MSASFDNTPPPKNRLSTWIVIVIVFLGLIFLALVFFTYFPGSGAARLVAFSLQSDQTADYQQGASPGKMAFAGMPLIAQAIFDSGEGNVGPRLETVQSALQNPVPTVTPVEVGDPPLEPTSSTLDTPPQAPTTAPTPTSTSDPLMGTTQLAPTLESEPSPEAPATPSSPGESPNRVILAAPEGHIFTDTPVFQWQPVSDATNYAFSLFSPEGLIHNQLISPDLAACTTLNRLCRYAPNLVLDANTAYLFQVMAVNENGYGPLGDGMMFYRKSGDPDPPDGVTLLSPENGEKVTDWTPLLSWEPVAGAQWYRVTVRTLADEMLDKWVAAGDACPGATCVLDLTVSLPPGTYSWTVVAFNAGGFGSLTQPFRMDIQ